MYLISLYFDEQTNQRIQNLVKQVYKKVGNDSMMHIPAHLTLASFSCSEQEARERFNQIHISSFELNFVSIGFFLPSVIFIQPIQSIELENAMKIVHANINHASSRYKPHHWIAHVTIGKHLCQDELPSSLQAIQSTFIPFTGKVIKIGLAQTNPYRDICVKPL